MISISSAQHAAAMDIPPSPFFGASRALDEPMSEMAQMLVFIAVALVLALVVRYLLRRWLGKLLVRKANAFCPQCFSARIRRVGGESGNPLNFLLPTFTCQACGKRFHRGRKPPFARCPVCRSADLESVARLNGSLRNSVRAMFGAHAYRCRKCATNFADRRPLRSSVALPEQVHAVESPGPSQDSTNL